MVCMQAGGHAWVPHKGLVSSPCKQSSIRSLTPGDAPDAIRDFCFTSVPCLGLPLMLSKQPPFHAGAMAMSMPPRLQQPVEKTNHHNNKSIDLDGNPPFVRIHSHVEIESLKEITVLEFEVGKLGGTDSITRKKARRDFGV